jgi:hypothetical protein
VETALRWLVDVVGVGWFDLDRHYLGERALRLFLSASAGAVLGVLLRGDRTATFNFNSGVSAA